MYPQGMDVAHLREEEKLAGMMKSPRLNSKEEFSSIQWAKSKVEFWSVVTGKVDKSPAKFVNIGCGFDDHFAPLEQAGHTFINFDMIFAMLSDLQERVGARSCVGGDIGKLPLRKHAFDYVICIDVIHHEYDQLFSVLESFRDLLRPGGTLFLEDPNAWGLFQMAKSILLPKPVYRKLRSTYHRLKRYVHQPADYEFPTSVWRVMSILKNLGFNDITSYPHHAYPAIAERNFRAYQLLSHFEFVRKFHNYHYMVSATVA